MSDQLYVVKYAGHPLTSTSLAPVTTYAACSPSRNGLLRVVDDEEHPEGTLYGPGSILNVQAVLMQADWISPRPAPRAPPDLRLRMQDASEVEIKSERAAEVLILQGDMIRRAFADFGEAGARLEQSLWSVLAKDIALRELVVHHPYSDRGQARSEPARTSRPHLGRASATPRQHLARTAPAPRAHTVPQFSEAELREHVERAFLHVYAQPEYAADLPPPSPPPLNHNHHHHHLLHRPPPARPPPGTSSCTGRACSSRASARCRSTSSLRISPSRRT